jgi:NitT/TauT family transport system ATP-binding protein
VATHRVDMPRPRRLDTTYQSRFVELVRNIRDEIAQVRAEGRLAALPTAKVA